MATACVLLCFVIASQCKLHDLLTQTSYVVASASWREVPLIRSSSNLLHIPVPIGKLAAYYTADKDDALDHHERTLLSWFEQG